MLENIGLPAKPALRGNNWVVDSSHCQGCNSQFTFINRKVKNYKKTRDPESHRLSNPSLLDKKHKKLNPIMEMDMVVPVPPVDFNFDSACSSPYMTAPSSPQRFGSFFFSAPTSPSRAFAFYCELNDLIPRNSASSVPFNWEEKPKIPKSKPTNNGENNNDSDYGYGDGDGEDFEFNFSGQLERTSFSADELFDGGKIRPLKLQPRLHVGPGKFFSRSRLKTEVEAVRCASFS